MCVRIDSVKVMILSTSLLKTKWCTCLKVKMSLGRARVGTIAMDQLMIDLTGIEGVNIGDEVTLFGYAKEGVPSMTEVSEWAGTLSHEIACAISRRVPKV